MPINRDLFSPVIRPFSLNEVLGEKTLRAIDVFAPGNLSVTDVDGNLVTVTFPTVANGGGYPCRWEVQIRQVHSALTTIDIANLVGLH